MAFDGVSTRDGTADARLPRTVRRGGVGLRSGAGRGRVGPCWTLIRGRGRSRGGVTSGGVDGRSGRGGPARSRAHRGARRGRARAPGGPEISAPTAPVASRRTTTSAGASGGRTSGGACRRGSDDSSVRPASRGPSIVTPIVSGHRATRTGPSRLTGTWPIARDGGRQPRWRREGALRLGARSPAHGGDHPDRRDRSGGGATSPVRDDAALATEPRPTYAVSADGQRWRLNAPIGVESPSLTRVRHGTG